MEKDVKITRVRAESDPLHVASSIYYSLTKGLDVMTTAIGDKAVANMNRSLLALSLLCKQRSFRISFDPCCYESEDNFGNNKIIIAWIIEKK